MARKPQPPPQDPLLDLDPDEQQEFELYEFLNEIGPGVAFVDIFRMMPNGSRPHIERVTMDALREDVYSYLRTHGSGKYLLQFMNGQKRYMKAKVLEVFAKDGPVAAPVNNTNDQLLTFMQQQMAQQQTLILALITNMGQNKGPDLSFLAGVLRPPDMTPVTTLMSAMISAKPATPPLDGVQLAKTIVEMSRDIGGGAEEQAPDTFWGAAAQVGKSLFSGFQGFNHQTLGSPGQVTILPPAQPMPPGPPQLPPAPVHNPDQPEEPLNQATFALWLRRGIAELKRKALANKDPELQAEYIMDNTDESMWSAVAGALQQGATMDHLLQFDPEIGQNPQLKAWFGEFYNALHAEIFNPVDSAGTGGNQPDAGSNAGTGPAGPLATPDPGTGSPAG